MIGLMHTPFAPPASPFPLLSRIEPVLAAIEGFAEFKVIRRAAFTTVDYGYMRAESFGCLVKDPPDAHFAARLRREARGLKFDNEGGLVARPFQKFFNLGEKPETQASALAWGEPHLVLDKLDGSLVHPFLIDDHLRWATRNGETPQAAQAAAHMMASGLPYEAFARALIALGYTPLFEFTGPENRIVIRYETACAFLLAARRLTDGAYMRDDELRRLAADAGIPVVRAWGHDIGSLREFIAHTQGLENAEGYVVRFASGEMIKLKAQAYALRHSALSDISSEKFTLRVVLENAEDDLAPLLPDEIADRLRRFAEAVRAALARRAEEMAVFLAAARAEDGQDRKAYAARVLSQLPPALRPAAFKAWEGADVARFLAEQLLRAATTQDRIEEARPLLDGARWTLALTLEA